MDKVKIVKLYALWLLFSLILTVLGAVVGTVFLTPKSGFFVGFLGILLMIAFCVAKGYWKKILFIVFCFGEGLSIGGVLYLVSPDNASYFILAIVFTIAMTIVAGFIGLKMKDLGYLWRIMIISLILYVIFSVVSIFIAMPFLVYIGVLLFLMYIVFDMNQFKYALEKGSIKTSNQVLDHVMDMYLNILNLFLHVLELIQTD